VKDRFIFAASIAFLLLFAGGIAAIADEEQPVPQVVSAPALPDTPYVKIATKDEDGALSLVCSGSYIGNNYVLTAGHCFFGADIAPTKYLVLDDKGNVYKTLVAMAEAPSMGFADFMILKIWKSTPAAADWKPLPLDCNPDLKPNDDVLAFGFPPANDESAVTLSRGYVNGVERMPTPAINWTQPLIHLTLPVAPGSSGGPLVKDGKQVGIMVGVSDPQPSWAYAQSVVPVCNVLNSRVN
jgi:S1-C subfamily serine protease